MKRILYHAAYEICHKDSEKQRTACADVLMALKNWTLVTLLTHHDRCEWNVETMNLMLHQDRCEWKVEIASLMLHQEKY